MEVLVMDYYKVISERGSVVCITPVKFVAQQVLQTMVPRDKGYKIEVVKGDIYLLDNL